MPKVLGQDQTVCKRMISAGCGKEIYTERW